MDLVYFGLICACSFVFVYWLDLKNVGILLAFFTSYFVKLSVMVGILVAKYEKQTFKVIANLHLKQQRVVN